MTENFELRWVENIDGVSTIRYNKVVDVADYKRQLYILTNNPNVEEVVLYSSEVVYKKGEE